jgi:TolB-like protein
MISHHGRRPNVDNAWLICHHPRVRNFFEELKRRNVFRVGAAYLVSAWLLIQLVETILPAFGFGDAAVRLVVILLALGLLPVLVLAWVFEVTPEGLRRDGNADPSPGARASRRRRLNIALAVLLVLALGYFALDRLLPAPAQPAVPAAAEAASPGAAVPPTVTAAATPAPARSVAVLPFVAMSSGEDDGYFADGLTEEILNALASLPELLVTARTSAFHFKGTDLPVPEIAATLGVAHVVEGSVRRAGERVRITAQLIRAADGFHLWSQAYDRTLKDVFAVQEDIARNIAEVLEVALDDAALASMRSAGLGDVEAYVAYQKGREAFAAAHQELKNVSEPLETANRWFDQVLAVAPQHTATRLMRADLLGHRLFETAAGMRPLAHPGEEAEMIAALAEEYAQAWQSAQPGVERTIVDVERSLFTDDWTGLGERLDAALAYRGCTPGNWTNQVGDPFGRAAATEAFVREMMRCDPLSSIGIVALAWAQLWSGQGDAALATIDDAEGRQLNVPFRRDLRAIALLVAGRHAENPQIWASAENGSIFAFPPALLREALAGDRERARQMADEVRARPGLDDYTQLLVSALVGDRPQANAAAANIDARPGGAFALLMAVEMCACGAPFDLEATPRLQARLSEAGFDWPPPKPIDYPLKWW